MRSTNGLADVGAADQDPVNLRAARTLPRLRQDGLDSLRSAASLPRAPPRSPVDLSSGKSMPASRACQLREAATRARMRAENSPASERAALRAASVLAASMRSATLSAWARSSRPLRNAAA